MKNAKIETTTLEDAKARSSDTVERSKLLAQKLDAQVKQVEQKQEKNATVKTQDIVHKDVKDFISSKTFDQLNDDKRTVIKEHRYYMMSKTADDKYNVFNKTMYLDDQNNYQLLTRALMRKFTQDFISKIALNSKFTAQDILRNRVVGGAFGDVRRTALFETSLFVNDEQDADKKDIIAKMLKLKKNCVYYNANEKESTKKRYYFIRKA